jgi:hypothetical protein
MWRVLINGTWYTAENDATLWQWLREGRVGAETIVHHESWPNSAPLRQAPAFAASFQRPPTVNVAKPAAGDPRTIKVIVVLAVIGGVVLFVFPMGLMLCMFFPTMRYLAVGVALLFATLFAVGRWVPSVPNAMRAASMWIDKRRWYFAPSTSFVLFVGVLGWALGGRMYADCATKMEEVNRIEKSLEAKPDVPDGAKNDPIAIARAMFEAKKRKLAELGPAVEAAQKECDGPWAPEYKGTFEAKKVWIASEQSKATAGVACVEKLSEMGKQLADLKPDTSPKLALYTIDRVNGLIEKAMPECRDAGMEGMVKALSETKSKMELAAAHHRERNAVQTFPEDAKFIKAKLADSIAKAGQRKWSEADTALKTCENALESFKGTSVEKSTEWNSLQKQVERHRQTVQRELDRIAAREAADRAKAAALAAERGEAPALHPWDGACMPCEAYLKKRLNDPDSYDHVRTSQPMIEGRYWTVVMVFRASNMLGAKILTAKKFFIHQGQVVEVQDVE